MPGKATTNKPALKAKAKHLPPGHVKIMAALKTLLNEKQFNLITWADIAETAGVTQGLIYKYFRDKRNLLYIVLADYLQEFLADTEPDLIGIEGAFNKLRRIIWSNFKTYNENRVFAKILLLEVRNIPGYFQSEPYQMTRHYAGIILNIIEEGVKDGEIRDDISPRHIRNIILGGLEHLCLPGLIFNREIVPDVLTENLCKTIFEDIKGANAVKRPGWLINTLERGLE